MSSPPPPRAGVEVRGRGLRECRAQCKLSWCLFAEIRRARLQFKKGILSSEKYEKEINEYISYSIREQEKLGVDVLVHGEPERTDM